MRSLHMPSYPWTIDNDIYQFGADVANVAVKSLRTLEVVAGNFFKRATSHLEARAYGSSPPSYKSQRERFALTSTTS